MFNIHNENLSVADLVGLGRLLDRRDNLIGQGIGDDDFKPDLRHEVHGIFGPAIDFRMARLAAKALDLGDHHAPHTDRGQRFADLLKLERFDWEIEQRIAIGARYNRELDRINFPRVIQRPDRTSVYGQYTVFCHDRFKVQQRLSAVGVPTAVHYPIPLNEQPAYKNLCCSDCTPVARQIAKQVMSLPMSANLTAESLHIVADALYLLPTG